MAKLVLSDVAAGSITTLVTTINANSAATETALENTLSRDGTSPNAMGADLDMNANYILNLPEATTSGHAVRYDEFSELVEIVEESVPLVPTGVTPGSYTNTDLTVDEFGRITAANNGSGGGGGVSDGDKGDIVVSGAGTVWTIDSGVLTAFGRSLINDADATAGRSTLGLGTLATQNGTFSGTSSGTNTGDQTSIVGITGSITDFNTALTGADFATLTGSETLTNKTIALGSNTVSGTKIQFDTAVTDGNFLYVGDVTQYTDELAQDAVGAMVDASLTYVDGTPLLQRAALTGDATASAGSNALTLATVNANVGSFTNADITVNAKGLITAAANGSGGGGASVPDFLLLNLGIT